MVNFNFASIVATLLRISAASGTCGPFNDGAQQHGKYFGAAAFLPYFGDSQYMGILDNWNLFGQTTAGNAMKWAFVEPEQGNFHFSEGDAVVDNARRNGKLLRCHTLVWHESLPDWVKYRQWTKQSLSDALWAHVYLTVSHYKGACYAWDVVNEAVMDDGSLRDNVFLQVIGPEYITLAFQAAGQADPDAKLYYNDYNIDNEFGPSRGVRTRRDPPRYIPNPWTHQNPYNKIDAVKCIIDNVRATGAQIHGIGLQGHFMYNAVPSADLLTNIMHRFTDMDLEVAITELDIRMDFSNVNDYTIGLQSDGYANVARACMNTPRCVGITLWDFSDRNSSVPSIFPGFGSASPWDNNFVLKQAIAEKMKAVWCN